MPLALYALAAGAFGIGTTEFVIMGLLMEVGQDLGVTIAAAGLLVSGYALGVAVGAPLLTATTGRVPRKTLLLGLTVLFIVGNLACALAPDYWSLMAARVLTSFTHGTFFGVGSVVATALVPRNKAASAIALMFTGLTLANVLGVPLGTWIGQHYGWRATFWVVTVIGLGALAAIAFLVPRIQGGDAPRLADELKVLGRRQVLLGLGVTTLGFGGVFVAFTYIAPILTEVTGFDKAAVAPILLLFGGGLVLGNILGGKLADRALMPTLIGSLVALILALLLIIPASGSQWAMVVTVGLLGAAAFATVPPLQMRVLAKAEGAPNLASALNIGAFNLGNALGAWAGGMTIDHGPGLSALPIVAAAITLGGLGLALVSRRLDRGEAPAAVAVQSA